MTTTAATWWSLGSRKARVHLGRTEEGEPVTLEEAIAQGFDLVVEGDLTVTGGAFIFGKRIYCSGTMTLTGTLPPNTTFVSGTNVAEEQGAPQKVPPTAEST